MGKKSQQSSNRSLTEKAALEANPVQRCCNYQSIKGTPAKRNNKMSNNHLLQKRPKLDLDFANFQRKTVVESRLQETIKRW